jgi:hypothetical protein
VQAIQRRIASLEQSLNRPQPTLQTDRDADNTTENLQKQEAAIQERLNEAAEKFAVAQLGEALERDQYAERLEVIEQPSRPQQPIRPKRMMLLGLALGLAVAAGGALAIGTEVLDKTVRARGDLTRFVDSHLIVPIPNVETRRDRVSRRLRMFSMLGLFVLLVCGAVIAALYYGPPLDILWQEMTVKLPRYLNAGSSAR